MCGIPQVKHANDLSIFIEFSKNYAHLIMVIAYRGIVSLGTEEKDSEFNTQVSVQEDSSVYKRL